METHEVRAIAVAHGKSRGAIINVFHGKESLAVSSPLRMANQGEIEAHAQHQGAALPTDYACHVQTIDFDFFGRLAIGNTTLHHSADAKLAIAGQLNPGGQRFLIGRIAKEVGSDYNASVHDAALMAAFNRSAHATALVLPAVPQDGSDAVRRLLAAEAIMARLPAEKRRPIFMAVDGGRKNALSTLAYLQGAGKALVFIEWHGQQETHLELLEGIHALTNVPSDQPATAYVAFNAPRTFSHTKASVPLVLAGYGIQATAYRVSDPLQVLAILRRQAEGDLPPKDAYSRALGGWTMDELQVGPCSCPAHDDTIAGLADFVSGLPVFQRSRVHELYAVAADRYAWRLAVMQDRLHEIIGAKPLLASAWP